MELALLILGTILWIMGIVTTLFIVWRVIVGYDLFRSAKPVDFVEKHYEELDAD